jgi:DNA recombination protein RmuC
MQPFYTIVGASAVGVVLLVALIATRSRRRAKAAATSMHEALERAQQAESDIAQLRLAKFEMERRLGIEEQKSARIPDMEKALTAAAARIDASRQATVAAESATAVSNEAVKRLEDSLKEASQRLLAAERTQNDLQGRVDALRDEKAQMEQVLTAKAEAADHVEMVAAELRQRLAAAEQARDLAAAHVEEAAREKADLEGHLSAAEAQLTEKMQRIEALAEELHQASAQLEATREAKAIAEGSTAAAREAAGLADALHAETRQRLAAAEQARDQASARLAAAIEERSAHEIAAARAGAQVLEKTERTEALSEELRQVNALLESARVEANDQRARLAATIEEKSAHEIAAARAGAQALEKTGRAEALSEELRQVNALLESARTEASDQRARLAAAIEEKTAHEIAAARAGAQVLERTERTEALSEELHQVNALLESARSEASEQRARLAALAEGLDQERKHGAEKLAMLSEMRERMTLEFRQLAEDVMRRHSENIASQNRAQVEMVLTPLRERLAEFQQGLASAHEESRQERVALAEQIQQLTDSSAHMTAETQQLTLALKGKAKGLGTWGEMLLTSILERSGLTAGEDYAFRECYSEDGSERLRPDVIINLPGDERIVIDSKVPLTAFEAYVNAENDAESEAALANHAAMVRRHITMLAGRDHRSAAEKGRGFAVMFVPVEGALAAALRRDPELTALAVDGHVALATPATLMMALRAVANVWQVERRNRRAEEIAGRAGKLYDTFAGYLGDMELLGDYLLRARHAYEEALNKLSSGRDNLMNQVEQLKEMGAKTKTILPVLSGQQAADEPPAPPDAESPMA